MVAAQTRPGQACDWYAGGCGKIARFRVLPRDGDRFVFACGNHLGRLVRESAGLWSGNDDVTVGVIS